MRRADLEMQETAGFSKEELWQHHSQSMQSIFDIDRETYSFARNRIIKAAYSAGYAFTSE